jgi:hypothetical protein
MRVGNDFYSIEIPEEIPSDIWHLRECFLSEFGF